jgi:hypothetical protein
MAGGYLSNQRDYSFLSIGYCFLLMFKIRTTRQSLFIDFVSASAIHHTY